MAIAGAHDSILEIQDVRFAQEGQYHVRVMNSEGYVNSDPVWLETTVPPPGPQLFARINFQTNVAAPHGWLRDSGQVYGDRGNGFFYGWDGDNTGTMRLRNNITSPDFQHDTLAHMQNGGTFSWRIALPNGSYQVRIVAGDPGSIDSAYKINVEDTPVVDGTPTSGNRWFEGQVTVTVSDGFLDVTSAAGAQNNKICFIEIYAVPEVGSSYEVWAAQLPRGERTKAHQHEGIPNLLRYALGGTAATPLSHLQLRVQTLPNSVQVTFNRIADPTLTYELWRSEDLQDWGLQPVWTSTGAHNIAGEITFTDSLPGASPARSFFRLRVRD